MEKMAVSRQNQKRGFKEKAKLDPRRSHFLRIKLKDRLVDSRFRRGQPFVELSFLFDCSQVFITLLLCQGTAFPRSLRNG